MNHTTTIRIAAAIIALALIFSTGIYAANTAYAGGRGGEHDDGDRVAIKKAIKNHCWAVNSSDFDQCNQEFNANVVTSSTAPTPPPVIKTCEQCFTSLLTQAQITAYLNMVGSPSLTDFCEAAKVFISESVFRFRLTQIGVDATTQNELVACLKDTGIVFSP